MNLTYERRHLEFEACFRDARSRLADGRIGVERVVDEQPLDEVVDDGGDAVHATEPILERFRLFLRRLGLSRDARGRADCGNHQDADGD